MITFLRMPFMPLPATDALADNSDLNHFLSDIAVDLDR